MLRYQQWNRAPRASMRPLYSALVFHLILQAVLQPAKCQSFSNLNVSDVQVDSGFDRSMGGFWNGTCIGNAQIRANITTQVATKNYMAASIPERQYASPFDTHITFTSNTVYQIPNPLDVLIVSATLILDCQGIIITDYVVLTSQTNSTWNGSNTGYVTGQSVGLNLNVTSFLSRTCPFDRFGFNCDQSCNPVDNGIYCVNCSADGQPYCCPRNNNIDQITCIYNNATTTPYYPWNGYTGAPTSSSKEKLFMWLMIGMAALALVLIIIVIIVIVILCTRQPTQKLVSPVYIEPAHQRPPLPPYERRDTYRGEPYPQQQRPQSRRSRSNPRVAPEYSNQRRNPDPIDDSFDDWEEPTPQPRRTARTPSRRVSDDEPRDMVV